MWEQSRRGRQHSLWIEDPQLLVIAPYARPGVLLCHGWSFFLLLSPCFMWHLGQERLSLTFLWTSLAFECRQYILYWSRPVILCEVLMLSVSLDWCLGQGTAMRQLIRVLFVLSQPDIFQTVYFILKYQLSSPTLLANVGRVQVAYTLKFNHKYP